MSGDGLSDLAKFDEYASTYEQIVANGISISGEDRKYFAQRRLEWLRDWLARLDARPAAAMDFGCGTGSTIPFLIEILGVKSVLGVDVSAKSLDLARGTFGSQPALFLHVSEYEPAGEMDLVFCSSVFHHVPSQDRAASVEYVYRSLRPGGIFSLWENNPWNPVMRYVMRRIAFDKDAVTLTAPQAQRLLKTARFQILRTDFLFIFPRPLAWLRVLEPSLSGLPLLSLA